MRDVIHAIQCDIDQMSRLVQQTMRLLSSTDRSTSPIRYWSVIEQTTRLRVLWKSHVELSHRIYGFIQTRDPSFKALFEQTETEHRRLGDELRLLAPTQWPRTTELGLNSLRTRAFHTLPSLMRQLEQETMTVLPLLNRWVYGGAPDTTAVESEVGFVVRRIVSA